MPAYVVSKINFFNNVLESELINALDCFDALFKSFGGHFKYLYDMEYETMDDLKGLAFDCDETFEVFEI